MNTTNQTNNPTVGSREFSGAAPPQIRIVDDAFLLDDPADDLPQIDWLSVRQFLAEQDEEVRDDATGRARFGRWANEAADGYGMVFTPAHDDFLGTVRLFPRLLLKKVYCERRAALKWPPLARVIEALPETARVMEDAPSPEVTQVKELTLEQLRAVAHCAQDPKMREAAAAVARFLETNPALQPDASQQATIGQGRRP